MLINGVTERDSRKDEAVVFIFIVATAGLLIWAAAKPWIGKWVEVSYRSLGTIESADGMVCRVQESVVAIYRSRARARHERRSFQRVTAYFALALIRQSVGAGRVGYQHERVCLQSILAHVFTAVSSISNGSQRAKILLLRSSSCSHDMMTIPQPSHIQQQPYISYSIRMLEYHVRKFHSSPTHSHALPC